MHALLRCEIAVGYELHLLIVTNGRLRDQTGKELNIYCKRRCHWLFLFTLEVERIAETFENRKARAPTFSQVLVLERYPFPYQGVSLRP